MIGIDDKYLIQDSNLQHKIVVLCEMYQEERVSGFWYITETGLRKISKLIGLDRTTISLPRKRMFHRDCIDTAQGNFQVKNALYYYQYQIH